MSMNQRKMHANQPNINQINPNMPNQMNPNIPNMSNMPTMGMAQSNVKHRDPSKLSVGLSTSGMILRF